MTDKYAELARELMSPCGALDDTCHHCAKVRVDAATAITELQARVRELQSLKDELRKWIDRLTDGQLEDAHIAATRPYDDRCYCDLYRQALKELVSDD
jgi:hypothetical protein